MSRFTCFIGIDPGLSGAIGIMSLGGYLDVRDMPLIEKGVYDVPAMKRYVNVAFREKTFVMLERQQAMPGQGVSSTFKTGMGYGIWLGVLAAEKIAYEIVSPVTWKKRMVGSGGKDKLKSIARAKALFPGLEDKFLKSKDGRAEAMLLAEYARIRGMGRKLEAV